MLKVLSQVILKHFGHDTTFRILERVRSISSKKYPVFNSFTFDIEESSLTLSIEVPDTYEEEKSFIEFFSQFINLIYQLSGETLFQPILDELDTRL